MYNVHHLQCILLLVDLEQNFKLAHVLHNYCIVHILMYIRRGTGTMNYLIVLVSRKRV